VVRRQTVCTSRKEWRRRLLRCEPTAPLSGRWAANWDQWGALVVTKERLFQVKRRQIFGRALTQLARAVTARAVDVPGDG
jgi:hypothetical protein